MPLRPPDKPWLSKQEFGYTAWAPQPKTLLLLEHVGEILDAYINHLPLTVRQIYYLLIGGYGYSKGDHFAQSLGAILVKARRALWYQQNPHLRRQLLLFDCVRDDKAIRSEPYYYKGVDDFMWRMRDFAEALCLDRQRGQPRRLVLWCEASGMVPQFERIAHQFGIAVFSGKGFNSVTEKRRLPMQWARGEQPITILHVGDLDPSGIHVFNNLAHDMISYGLAHRANLEFVRLALLLSQTSGLIEHAPPNPNDTRDYTQMLVHLQTRREGVYVPLSRQQQRQTWQLEALRPDVLANIVRGAIESRLDWDVYNAVLREENAVRDEVLRRLGDEPEYDDDADDDDYDPEPRPFLTRPTRSRNDG